MAANLPANIRFLKSTDCNRVLSEFLTIDRVLKFNVLNKLFYNVLIPKIMKNRGIYPTITPELHLLIKENALWAL